MKQVNKLNPFGRFCCTIGNLPTSYMESLTYEQQLMWFCKYLEEKVVPAINENADAIIELQEYLKNLDLQDEVNNKLDEMAEDGSLANIINQEIFTQINDDLNTINNTLISVNNNLNNTMSTTTTNTTDIDNLKTNKANNSDLLTFENTVNQQLSSQFELLSQLQGGTPIVVTDVADMTDTSKIYVLTTDGKWYYYNGSNFVVGGDYQESISDELQSQLDGYEKELGFNFFGLGAYSSQAQDFTDTNKYAICLYADGRHDFTIGLSNTSGNLFSYRIRKHDGTQATQINNASAIEWTADASEDTLFIEIWKGGDNWGTTYTNDFINNFKFKIFDKICDRAVDCMAIPIVYDSTGTKIASYSGNWLTYRLSLPAHSVIHVFGHGANAYPTIVKTVDGQYDSVIFSVGAFNEVINKPFYFEKACDLIIQLLVRNAGTFTPDIPYVKILQPKVTGYEDKVFSIIGDSYVANNEQPVELTWHYKLASALKMKYNNKV